MVAVADYFPDPPFNAYEFERFYHRASSYQPDAPPPKEEELPNDYVPTYSWLESAIRNTFAFKPTLPPALPFVPLLAPEPSPVSGITQETKNLLFWIIESNKCLAAAIEDEDGSFTLEDVDLYLEITEQKIKEIRQLLQPKKLDKPKHNGWGWGKILPFQRKKDE